MTFSIRDLLWLMVVVALILGWWVERSRLLEQMLHVETQLEYQKTMNAVQRALLDNLPNSSAPDPYPP